MIEDHLGVVDETGAAVEGAHSRLWELLDREILPCLERPGRLLGPFDLPLRAQTGHSNVALIWPSVVEGVQAPAALRPMFEIVGALRELQPGVACAPAADLERMLDDRHLPFFSRPQWTPLAEHPLWIAVLAEPLDLLGLVTVLRSARVPQRAADRRGAPAVILTGPGAERAGDLALVFGDAVLAQDDMDAAWFSRLEAAIARPQSSIDAVRKAGLGSDGRIGALVAPATRPTASTVIEVVGVSPGPRREEVATLIVRGVAQLRRPRRERLPGRSTAFTDRVWVGSASARLRAEFAMADGDDLARTLAETFAVEAGAAALDFVWGLPGETAADRAALAPLLTAIVAAAPRGVRQVRVRVGWYVPSREEREAGMLPISADAAAASLNSLRTALDARRLRIDTAPPGLAQIAALLDSAPPEFAPVLETMHAAGARTSEAAQACDAPTWQRALEEYGLAHHWPAAAPGALEGAPADHGFAVRSSAAARGSSAAAPSHGSAVRADRWTRWQALVPQQFDVRIEFGKLDRLRLLGPGELTDLFLGALERAQIPLATSGLVEPKPKISFGPSLPAGIVGEREVVDLGLALPVPDLLDRLRSELPAGIELRAAVALPPHAPHLALGQIALAEYAVEVRADQFVDPQAQATSLERLHIWRRRIQAGRPCVDEADDVLRQIRDLQLHLSSDGVLTVRFALDLRDSGPKCKPRDVLSRGLGELSVDVRCLPLRRLRLLVFAEEPVRVVPTTPFELVLRASRRQRARAKFSA